MSSVLYVAMQRPSNGKLRLYVLKIDASFSFFLLCIFFSSVP